MDQQIFQTNSPTRWRSFKWTGRIIATIILFLMAVLVLAIIRGQKPNLPNLNERAKAYEAKLDPANKLTLASPLNKKYKGFKEYLWKKQQEDSINKINSKALKTSLVRSAFYTPWTASSLADLKKNADKLNTIYPEWFFIDTLNYTLQTRIDTAGLAVMRQNKLSIEPMFINFHSLGAALGYFDSELLHKVLNDPAISQRLIQQIVDTLTYYKLQGINIDFENLTEKSNESLTAFQKKLYEALHPKGFLVSMDVQAMNEDYDFKQLGNFNDHVILMAYDQYSDVGNPGPISSQKWIEQQMDWMDDRIDASKIILGVAGYGYDWTQDDGGKKIVNPINYADAISDAKLSASSIIFDNDSYNLHYSYIEPATDSAVQKNHTIWLTDAATLFNVVRFSDDYQTAGTALWHLGSEDPRIWSFYGRDMSTTSLQKHPFNFSVLETIPPDPNTKPTATGEGELLSVIYSPQQGRIKLEIDSTEMLIAEQQYVQLPSGYVYEKFAEDKTEMGPGHKIILTFDDGPGEYTPKILDILEKEKVPATFFIIGINAEKNIPLLQREFRDGYEIGNHTFTHGNIAKMTPERAALEMKTTRLLLECVTGHSTILFRAPYNADSEPQTFEEIEPIARSKKDNYITVGESIDPNDWDPRMNADSIYTRTVRMAEANNASIILLHDAGGDTRQPTVDALPRIIAYFKKRGCKFTTVADLMGKDKDTVMPPVKRSWVNSLNFFFAEVTYWGSQVLFAFFIVGIFLSVARMVVMALLASIQKRREPQAFVSAEQPPVSVIVPAYNEEINAVRTIQSLLQQNYPNLQVIFVDDGSTDGTYDKVREHYKDVPNVQVVTKKNGGKATALNYGINICTSEYVVCIDADTQLKSDAVTELMKKFISTDSITPVGAVAGNVKVGNEVNMITHWQSIEYITSQNFDRRAFDLLNCITVVPGAIGAFKKAAIIEAGGFTSDTLAEDCDLTMRLHRKGYQVRNCTSAISYTEAPETVKQFLKQRFRWSFGVIQCFWKHRDALFNPRYKNFGLIALPNILIFQVILPFLAPFADLILVISLIAAGFGIIPPSFEGIILFYVIFSLVDIAGAAIAFSFEKENYRKLLWMIPQRFVYRQLMYYILIKSFNKALKGELQGWGALKRTGNVKQAVTA